MLVAVIIRNACRMRKILTPIVICIIVLVTISACKKKTEYEVASPIGSLSKIGGIKQWHGKYTHAEYNIDSSHIDYIETDTSLSFALTVLDNATITYNVSNYVGTLHYQHTDESFKALLYMGNDGELYYYYTTGKIVFSGIGINSNGLNVGFELTTP